jgi:hypothetical protein
MTATMDRSMTFDSKIDGTPDYCSSVYLSGPMSNIPEFNFPLFDSAAEWLRTQGYHVYSPADNDRAELAKQGIDDVTTVAGYDAGNVRQYNEAIGDTKDLFRWDFSVITHKCVGIVFLPGWEHSTGARWERVVAEALGLHVELLSQEWVDGEFVWQLTPDPVQDRLSQHLTSFSLAGAAITPREAIAALQVQLGHHPSIADLLSKIEGYLA